MILNDVIALMLPYFTEFGKLVGGLHHSGRRDGPIVFAEYPLPLLAKFDPRCCRTVSLR